MAQGEFNGATIIFRSPACGQIGHDLHLGVIANKCVEDVRDNVPGGTVSDDKQRVKAARFGLDAHPKHAAIASLLRKGRRRRNPKQKYEHEPPEPFFDHVVSLLLNQPRFSRRGIKPKLIVSK